MKTKLFIIDSENEQFREIDRWKVNSPKQVYKVIKDFLQGTAIHGCRHVISVSRLRSILWSLILISCYIGCTVHMTNVIIRYKNKFIQMDFKEEITQVLLPDVVVCSSRRWSDNQMAISSPDKLIKFKQTQQRLSRLLGQIKRDDVRRFVGDALTVSLPYATEFGVQPYDLIVDCNYNDNKCSYRDFILIHSDAFHNCYRLNFSYSYVVSNTDYWRGLQLLLHIEDSNWDEHPTKVGLFGSKGAALILRPFQWKTVETKIEKDAIWIGTGTDNRVAFKNSKISRTSTNIRNCGSQLNVYLKQEDSVKTINYSANVCVDLMINSLAYKRCGCYLAWLPIPPDAARAKPCLNYNFSYDNNDLEALSNFFHRENCSEITHDEVLNSDIVATFDCPAACDESTVHIQHSHLNLPTEEAYAKHFEDLIVNRVLDIKSDYGAENFTAMHKLLNSNFTRLKSVDIIKNNLVRVLIHSDSQTVLHRIESLAFPLDSLISEIGGIFSFWLGGSIVAAFEIGELMIRLGTYCSFTIRFHKNSRG